MEIMHIIEEPMNDERHEQTEFQIISVNPTAQKDNIAKKNKKLGTPWL